MTERLSIAIDYPPKGRDVWLFRGELDRIIERSLREPAQVPPRPLHQHCVLCRNTMTAAMVIGTTTTTDTGAIEKNPSGQRRLI